MLRNTLRDSRPCAACAQWYGDGCYLFSYTAGAGASQRDVVGVCAPGGERPPASGENFDWSPEAQQAEVVAALERAKLPSQTLRIARSAERMIRIGLFRHEPLHTWSKGRFVLMGDAAHAMLPFTGQGANAAIADAWCLASRLALVGASEGEVPTLEAALQAFERRRRPQTDALMAAGAQMAATHVAVRRLRAQGAGLTAPASRHQQRHLISATAQHKPARAGALWPALCAAIGKPYRVTGPFSAVPPPLVRAALLSLCWRLRLPPRRRSSLLLLSSSVPGGRSPVWRRRALAPSSAQRQPLADGPQGAPPQADWPQAGGDAHGGRATRISDESAVTIRASARIGFSSSCCGVGGHVVETSRAGDAQDSQSEHRHLSSVAVSARGKEVFLLLLP